MLKNNKGITLIALVITIIILLILAAVTIATLIGDNGILTRVNKAKTSNAEGEVKDEFALIANEWLIEKNANNKNLGDFLNEKLKEGKITSIADNGDEIYTIKLNEYQTIIDQNGKISSVFNSEKWDRTATPEDCFIWGSDTEGEDGYGTVIGYTENINNYTKLRYPTRCTNITFEYNESRYNEISSEESRAFTNNILKVEIPQTVTSIEKYAFGSSGGELYSFNKLEEITIPKSVVSMGDFIFYVGTALKIINCESEEKPASWSDKWNYAPWQSPISAKVVWGYTED